MRKRADLENEIAKVGALTRDELTAAWTKAYGCPPPKGIKRGLLERSAAWHLPQNDAPDTISIVCPFSIRRRGVEVRMVLTDGSAGRRKPDPVLINLLRQAHLDPEQLTDGQSRNLKDIAELMGPIHPGSVCCCP